MIIEYATVREEILHPARGNSSDAGLDLFYNPPDISAETVIAPGSSAKLETAITVAVPHGYMLQIMNRSSIASKRNLIVGAHVVDAGYTGEIFIDIHNIGTKEQVINPGTKIAQAVLVPIVPARVRCVPLQQLFKEDLFFSDRGAGALGSTDDDDGAAPPESNYYTSGESDDMPLAIEGELQDLDPQTSDYEEWMEDYKRFREKEEDDE